ncbi:MAG: 2-amino-4-hydroxy-6-hydroxymethyldihydropteridine diphosphokinase [Gammaproteobacteria bacterium]|nr:MAG: 2-amino-4-hydroxy-6-hydroxymethyldihydropteridine diphosphokinase [Gammaproteobacteria bacterium]
MAQVYISVGSNLERERNIATALQALTESYGELQQSSVYESAAVGFDSAPFYNLVVGFSTQESPRVIQDQLHAIEDRCGRQRTATLSARTLDLDLLLYDDQVMTDGKLVLPREDINRYAFVLGPLAEIAAASRHPVTAVSYAEMWAAFDDSDQPLTRIDWPPTVRPVGE